MKVWHSRNFWIKTETKQKSRGFKACVTLVVWFQNGYAALHIAVKKRRIRIILLLLREYNADPNIANESGMTPLHVACFFGFDDVSNTFLSHGSRDPAKFDTHVKACEFTFWKDSVLTEFSFRPCFIYGNKISLRKCELPKEFQKIF